MCLLPPVGRQKTLMRAVYAIAHHLPCARHDTVKRVTHWLKQQAVWEGGQYTDQLIPMEFHQRVSNRFGPLIFNCSSLAWLAYVPNMCSVIRAER